VLTLLIWRFIFTLIAIAYLIRTGWFEDVVHFLKGDEDGF